MELDDYKAGWAQQTALLESSLRLNDLLVRQSNAGRAQTSLQRLGRGLTIELVLLFATVVALGSFAADHLAQPAVAICAALLGVYGLAIAQGEIRQLVALRDVDFDEPVIAVQRKLERLRLVRLRTTQWALLFGPLLWLPICAVLVGAFTGADLFAILAWPYIATNALLGLAAIPLSMWIANRYRGNERATRFFRGLSGEITGAQLRAALDFVDGIERFETAA
jgi:class 3 adenylate cyclase